jgi:demethylmenaquinone methyltransferase/2-methoxy-6-polyprenyl-1,4-benzoquinol methylase
MPLFDHFEIFAPYYDRVIQSRDIDQLVSLLELPIDGNLLDVGGGTGRISGLLDGMAVNIILADLSFGMLMQAKGKNGLKLVCSHSEKLPFPDEWFERIIMVDALHHVCDQLDTVSELWRVLRPSGKIIIEEPDVRTLPVKIVAFLEKITMMRSHFITPSKIAALFNHQDAHIFIETSGYNSWIVVNKLEK